MSIGRHLLTAQAQIEINSHDNDKL